MHSSNQRCEASFVVHILQMVCKAQCLQALLCLLILLEQDLLDQYLKSQQRHVRTALPCRSWSSLPSVTITHSLTVELGKHVETELIYGVRISTLATQQALSFHVPVVAPRHQPWLSNTKACCCLTCCDCVPISVSTHGARSQSSQSSQAESHTSADRQIPALLPTRPSFKLRPLPGLQSEVSDMPVVRNQPRDRNAYGNAHPCCMPQQYVDCVFCLCSGFAAQAGGPSHTTDSTMQPEDDWRAMWLSTMSCDSKIRVESDE